MAYRKILSLDGGGIRGLIPARILEEIETQTKQPVHKLFDLISGTSTGGILAVGLTTPRTRAGARPCTAKEMVDLYAERGNEIFSRSFWKSVTSLGDEKYDAAPLERILHDMLGDAELKDTVRDIVVTSYDIEARKPYLFKTSRAKETSGRNHLLRHVARATSAAPTCFEAFLLDESQWANEAHHRRALVDGGVFANNPSMIALSEALSSNTPSLDFHGIGKD